MTVVVVCLQCIKLSLSCASIQPYHAHIGQDGRVWVVTILMSTDLDMYKHRIVKVATLVYGE